jgi:hypothetical protein
MKVAITGHTKGLGKELSALFDDVVGLSRSNGYDIKDTKLISNAASDCDIFINNAYDGYAQIDLLYEMYNRWHNTDKLIVTIGSMASNAAEWRLKPCLYSTIKKTLDVATYQLVNSHHRKCKLMIFKPGYLGDSHVPYQYAAKHLYNAIMTNDYQTIEITLRS